MDYNWDANPSAACRSTTRAPRGSATAPAHGRALSSQRRDPPTGPWLPNGVKAQTEIKNSTAARSRAGFGTLQYKGSIQTCSSTRTNRIADNTDASFSSNTPTPLQRLVAERTNAMKLNKRILVLRPS